MWGREFLAWFWRSPSHLYWPRGGGGHVSTAAATATDLPRPHKHRAFLHRPTNISAFPLLTTRLQALSTHSSLMGYLLSHLKWFAMLSLNINHYAALVSSMTSLCHEPGCNQSFKLVMSLRNHLHDSHGKIAHLQSMKNKQLAKVLYISLRTIIPARTASMIPTLIRNFLGFCSNNEDPQVKEFGTYIQNYYAKKPEEWALALRDINAYTTNMSVENLHKQFKYHA